MRATPLLTNALASLCAVWAACAIASPIPEPDNFIIQECRISGQGLRNVYPLYAAGAYSGRRLDFQIDTSGHSASQIDVVVNNKTPVVLMLGAYEPTIWNISWTEGTLIKAVLLGGYHKHVIMGVGDNTPVLLSTAEQSKSKCGYFYVDDDRLGSLNPIAEKVFGYRVSKVFYADKGRVVVGEKLAKDAKTYRAGNAKPEDFRSRIASGLPALEQAVHNRLLRKATLADAQSWVEAAQKLPPPKHLPPVEGRNTPMVKRPLLMNAYVVQGPFTIPDGLYGGHSAVFFVPTGVPKPTGKLGHSTIYDMNTMTCMGLHCR